MDIFGRKKIIALSLELQSVNHMLALSEKDNELLKVRLKDIEKQRSDFAVMMEENIPKEQNARREYFSHITMSYTKFFKEKIRHMKSLFLKELSIMWKPDKEYETYRASLNVLNLLEDWFEYAERAHLSDLQEQRQAVEDTLGVSTVQEIKNKYQT